MRRTLLESLTTGALTEPAFREDLLADQPVADLLTEPVHVLADRWRL